MTEHEAIEILKTESCYECSYGCDSPVTCTCESCAIKDAVNIAIKALEEFRALKNGEERTVYLINNNTDSCCECDNLVVCDDYCIMCQTVYPQCADKPLCEKQFLEVVEMKASAKWIYENKESVFLTRADAERALESIGGAE